MSESKVFLLPDLGEGLAEAELVAWLVSAGDEIAVDQPIAEVETAKSVVEVPSPYAGTVTILHGEAGDTLDVGKPLISVTPVGSSSSAPTSPSPSVPAGPPGPATMPVSAEGNKPPAAEAAATAYREEEKAGSGNVLIGYGTPGGHGQARRNRPRRTGAATRAPVTPTVIAGPLESTAETSTEGRRSLAVSSPLVRRLASDNGVDLHSVHGTGTAGLITRRDVDAAIAAGSSSRTVEAEPRQVPAPDGRTSGDPEVDLHTGLTVLTRTPVKGVRKTVAANMSRSRTEVPEATVWVDVDATALIQLRADMKKRHPEDTPGLLAFIARFTISGLKRFPELNTRFQSVNSEGVDTSAAAADATPKEIIGFDGVNLGFAAQTDRGLVVPSIRNADRLSARGLDAEIRRLSRTAREGKATPADLSGSTFTLNNYGVFGVDGSAAIINYPEAAMLGVGRIIDRPWVVDGELTIRKIVLLTLVFDHRVCDGGAASAFLRHVVDAIESPITALADL